MLCCLPPPQSVLPPPAASLQLKCSRNVTKSCCSTHQYQSLEEMIEKEKQQQQRQLIDRYSRCCADAMLMVQLGPQSICHRCHVSKRIPYLDTFPPDALTVQKLHSVHSTTYLYILTRVKYIWLRTDRQVDTRQEEGPKLLATCEIVMYTARRRKDVFGFKEGFNEEIFSSPLEELNVSFS